MSLIYGKAGDVVQALRHELQGGTSEVVVDAALLRACEEILTKLADDYQEMTEQLDTYQVELTALRTDLDYLECRLEVDEYADDPYALRDPFEDLVG